MMIAKNTIALITVATASGLGMATSQTAFAGHASATLEVSAGLREAISLSCGTALDFGRTTLNTAAAVTLTVHTDGTVSIPDATIGVTTGDTIAGECTVSGADTDTVDILITGDTTMTGSVLGELAVPSTALALTFTTSLDASNIAVVNGSATFKVGGTLTIPAAVVSANLGGYSAQVTVTVTDAI